ncbi:UNVERIFIED_CONTAM: hypothetical protein FKN15_035178 [Acipenser sinensis]
MNYRPVAFLLLFSFSNYAEHDTVWAADKYTTGDPKLKGATDPPQINKGITADITESSAGSVGAKAGGSIAAVLFVIILLAVGICNHKRKWGRNIIVTPASELQPMTNPEQPPPDVMLSLNVPVTENGDTVA